ncbi:MAG: cobalt ECF transporter T component CbiQ [Clostridium sp.]|jgi:cobalt/nickel transport system permease protein|nr:cobalt ECF transporter T component CbiQ [Clostridium sp.]
MAHNHGEGVFSIDYYAYNSKIRNWSPNFKVGFSILTLLLCIILDNVYVSIIIIALMAYLNIVKSGLHIHDYISLMSIPLTFIILGSFAIAFGVSRKPTTTTTTTIGEYNINFYFFYISTSINSIKSTIFLVLKALGAISSTYLMTLSTPSFEIISVLRKCHVPSIITELMNLIYRYIFILMEVQCNMKNSAISRLGYRNFKTSCYSFGQILSNLLVVSFKKANEYYNALESRCYEGEFLFLEEDKKIKVNQIVYSIIFIIFIIAIALITK